jgi:flagellar biosynthetic protein FliO
VSTLLLLLKVGLVFGLLALTLWVLKRTDGLGARGKGGMMEVRGSTRLGKGAALTVVRVDGKDLLLGVTDHTVTLLTSETAPEAIDLPAPRRALLPALTKRAHGDVPDAAVAAALATLRGEAAPQSQAATDGPVAASTRLAVRRRVARMDALRDEEHLWTRACRPTFRAADGDDALA